jgi:hypothetical protein
MLGQPLQDVSQVGVRVVATELRRLQQAHDHCGALPGEFTAAE